MRLCIVCGIRPSNAYDAMCRICYLDYRRRGGDTQADHIAWAANRTRGFMQRTLNTVRRELRTAVRNGNYMETVNDLLRMLGH